MRSEGRIVGRWCGAVVVVNQSGFEIRHISNISGGRGKGRGKIVEGRLRPQRAVMYHQGCSSSSSASWGGKSSPTSSSEWRRGGEEDLVRGRVESRTPVHASAEGSRRENDDASTRRDGTVRQRRLTQGSTSKRLSQVFRKFDGHRTITASRKTCVIWNCVHHARKHLRGRRPPRDSGRADANRKV